MPRRDPAARQPRRALGQRPRRHPRPTSCRRSPQELVRGDYLDRVHIGLDFFDASINRVAAWVIGTRCLLKALLIALLEPTAALRELEAAGDFTGRLALLEELKTLPFGAVWDYHCLPAGRPGRAGVAGRGPGLRARRPGRARVEVTGCGTKIAPSPRGPEACREERRCCARYSDC